MSDKKRVRFILDDDNKAANFVYRPPLDSQLIAERANIGVKFAQRIVILDSWDWELKFRSPWGRLCFRLRHPYIYSKRGLYFFYRRIRRLFIKDKIYPCLFPRKWMSKGEAKKLWP